jgi:hypothetical protein
MTKRSKYKVCGRLGYNARMRKWFGKKRKWQKAKVFRSGKRREGKTKGSGVVNPGRSVTNEARRKGKGQTRGRVRIKDHSRRILMRRTGRKRRYGGVKLDSFRSYRNTQRTTYKQRKNRRDRDARKGRRRKEEGRKVSRLSRVETRVDVRRWRSGRVVSLQMGRDLIEHGKIQRVKDSGERDGRVKWQGKRRHPGQGRQVERGTWKTRKEQAKNLILTPEYDKEAAKYREVDYVTGTRYLYRQPYSGEVRRPKGRNLSRRR